MNLRLASRLVPALLLPALWVVACGGDEVRAKRSALPDRPSAFELVQADTVAGRTLEAAEEGVWTLRRKARLPAKTRPTHATGDPAEGAPEASADGAPEPEARRLAEAPAMVGLPARGGGHGGFYRGPGDDVPPGLREPTDATAPPPPPPSGPGPTSGPTLPTPVTKPRAVTPAAAPLRAGTTDDNVDFDAYLKFLATWTDQEGVADRVRPTDVADRRFLRVVDSKERPVPGARIHVVDERLDRVIWSGTTYGDGRVPFYPGVVQERLGADGERASTSWLVEVRIGEDGFVMDWDGEGTELVVPIDVSKPVAGSIALDVGILLDTTGSMGDEIARIKSTLLEMTKRLEGLEQEFDLRYGAVLYRDLGDVYVTKKHALTDDIDGFAQALQGVVAKGGGDTPESLNQGLSEAVGGLAWRPGAAKVLFLIADAPPHMDYEGDVPYELGALAAIDKGIRVHTVAASGLDRFGSLVFRQIAQLARGQFIFIEYGSPAQSAASHGVKGKTKSNNLDDILFEQIQQELARWGQPDPEPEVPAAADADPTFGGAAEPGEGD